MKFRKLIIGIFIVTAVVCSGGDLLLSSNTYTNHPKVSEVVAENNLNPEEGEIKEKKELPETALLYKFTLKIAQRFKSSPPRASPPV
ncbi:hypothetical protein SAMN06269117_102129 [Balnearium lithotrophicum]|uniref:Uncharacterized protein n=1 Tax=Balnearium lithotrophicum TaxID=223788 RepID=A0A521AUD1_9BACT|nr:hypothetical protein [Balnearium lithotrophicum]SMO38419.1 hypothetical protein SAMN06269117_102129 [Balnearium lithotrophicum]